MLQAVRELRPEPGPVHPHSTAVVMSRSMSDELDPLRLMDATDRGERDQQRQRSGPLKGRYEAGEHQWLGMRGATLACTRLGVDPESLRRLRRRAGDVELGYGEIVALSGDFYKDPDDLYEERPSPFPWLYESHDLSDIRKRFASELTWILDERRPANAGYPDNTIAFIWNAKGYLELAEDNTDHFGWHNVLRYCQCHQMAIDSAIQAQSCSAADASWVKALYYNGFADHFLTDAFAAGHVRIPRREIREWAPSRGFNGKLAGLLSKVLHDQDGHVSSLHAQGEGQLPDTEGLPVENPLGVKWSTRCDGQLFLVPSAEDAPLLNEPVNAVAASLEEVFRAQKEKRSPSGPFQALQHVPFPRAGSPSLTDKFHGAPAERIDLLLKSFRWYTKLPLVSSSLDKDNVAALFEDLPALMAAFRANVTKDHADSPVLQERLPEAYVAAFKKVA